MKVLGWLLIAAGALSMIGYFAYLYIKHFLFESAVPLILRLAPAAVALGVLVLIITVVYDRLSGRDTQEEG